MNRQTNQIHWTTLPTVKFPCQIFLVLFTAATFAILTGCHQPSHTTRNEDLQTELPASLATEAKKPLRQVPKGSDSQAEEPQPISVASPRKQPTPESPSSAPVSFSRSVESIPTSNRLVEKESNERIGESRKPAAPLFRMIHPAGSNSGESAEAFQPDTIVVCQKEWLQEMEDWFEYRQSQGHQFGVLCPPLSADQLKTTFNLHSKKKLQHVLLVGDVDVSTVQNLYNMTHKTKVTREQITSRKTWKNHHPKQTYTVFGIPTGIVASKVGQLLKTEIYVASDNWLVDFDQDGSPEVSIGRWPVNDPKQIQILTEKTIAYEATGRTGSGSEQVEVVAFGGGYGFVEDKLIESITKRLLSQLIPGHLHVNMTYGSWRSVYCPAPRNFQKEFFKSLNRPSLFWVYIGHGAPWAIDVATFPDQIIPTLNKRTVSKLQPGGHPIAIFIACSTGYFAGPSDSLSERMILHPNGPAATLSGSGVTAPYGLSNLAYELLRSIDKTKEQPIGTWIQQAKKKICQKRKLKKSEPAQADKFLNMFDQLGRLFSPTSKFLHRERVEHAHMMTLLGDPLIQLPRTKNFSLSVERNQGKFTIMGHTDHDQPVVIKVVHPRDKIGFRPKRRSKKKVHLEKSAVQMDLEYQRANSRLIATLTAKPKNGKFETEWNPGHLKLKKVWFRGKQVVPSKTLTGFAIWDQNAAPNKSVQKKDQKQEKTEQQKNGLKEPTTYQPKGKPVVLFNGKNLDGWKGSEFGGHQDPQLDDKKIRMDAGYPLTGIVYSGTKAFPLKKLPKTNYELEIDCMKEEGEDFFCGVTFPVGKSYCTFIPGGWGGGLTGLSCIDKKDASDNATKTFQKYEPGKWYKIRIRVTDEKIQCWVDKKKVVDQTRAGKSFGIRPEVALSKPLGVCNFQTTSLIKKFHLTHLKKVEAKGSNEHGEDKKTEKKEAGQ